jgi:hypothetical protein
MKRAVVTSIATGLIAISTVAYAYEPGTHAQLSDTAANQSVLVVPKQGTNTTVLQDLGLVSYTEGMGLF